MMMPAQVLIAEPHEVCRRAMVSVIADAERLAVVAEAEAISEVVELARLTQPSVVLVAVDAPGDCRIISEIRERVPGARVIVLSLSDSGEMVLEALRAGASGFVPKWAEIDEIVGALQRVADGEIAFHPSVAGVALVAAVSRIRSDESRRDTIDTLTGREREVLALLADGVTQKSMAARLHLSRRTIESHMSRVYRKLGVRGQIEAIRKFREVSGA